jgi:hypothetical protein
MDYTLKKRQNAKQVQVLEYIEKTFPKPNITSPRNIARLREPTHFPYKHKPRLYKEVTKDILKAFHELNGYFYYLPLSYRIKIINDTNFMRFFEDEVIKGTLKQKDAKENDDDVEKQDSYQLYMNLFSIGIEGLLRTMPSDFHNHLATQLKPIFSLMQSISLYSNDITGSKKVPLIKIPEILQSTEIPFSYNQ